MCLFNICNKSAAAFRRAAWRPGAVKPDNGPKHCWLIITPGFTAPSLSINSRGLFFPGFSPLCSCWHYVLQRMSQADPVCDLQKTQPNVSSSHTSQFYQHEPWLLGGHQKTQYTAQSWPGHLGKWLPTPWMTVTLQTQGRALGHHSAKRNPSTSGWGSSFSVCTYVLCMVVSKEMVEKILGEGTQFYLTYRFASPAKCKNGLRVLKIWMNDQTPEKSRFGYLLLVLPYCDRGELSRGTFHSEKQGGKGIRFNTTKQTAQPPMNTVRKQSYAAVNSCLLALIKLQLTSGVNLASIFVFGDIFSAGEERV